MQYTATLDLSASGGGAYASADDLLLVSDLSEVDLVVKGWKRNGEPLRIRVRALDFDQQEQIDRGALVKIDGVLVRSEARFAAHTLFHCILVPKLTLEQAQAMRKHNPTVISEIVGFVWKSLSVWDQGVVDAIVNAEIPGTSEPASDAETDDGGEDNTRVEVLDLSPDLAYATTGT